MGRGEGAHGFLPMGLLVAEQERRDLHELLAAEGHQM